MLRKLRLIKYNQKTIVLGRRFHSVVRFLDCTPTTTETSRKNMRTGEITTEKSTKTISIPRGYETCKSYDVYFFVKLVSTNDWASATIHGMSINRWDDVDKLIKMREKFCKSGNEISEILGN